MSPERYLSAVAALLIALPAQACLFARDAGPADWLAWSSALFAADVAEVSEAGSTDRITLRITETFKGPGLAESATLEVPRRMWAACRLERPAVGAHVLGALNANRDALLVPLTRPYEDELRKTIRQQ